MRQYRLSKPTALKVQQNLKLTILLLVLIFQNGLAKTLTAEEILAKHGERVKALKDVQSKAKLNLNLTAGFFPSSEQHSGRYFYLNPNNHKLEFDDAPSYFDKAPNMFRWKLPSQEKYKTKVKGPYGKGAFKTYEVLFLPKNKASSTQSISCEFSAQDWRLQQQATNYKDGGSVNLKFRYIRDSKLPVLDRVLASVSIPSYSLNGSAVIDFSEQKINKGIDKKIFKEK